MAKHAILYKAVICCYYYMIESIFIDILNLAQLQVYNGAYVMLLKTECNNY